MAATSSPSSPSDNPSSSREAEEGAGEPTCDDSVSRSNAYPSFADKMAKTSSQIQIFERLNGDAAGVHKVVDATVDAVCNQVPLTRYTVGYDALLMRFVLVWVPDRLMDLVQTYL